MNQPLIDAYLDELLGAGPSESAPATAMTEPTATDARIRAEPASTPAAMSSRSEVIAATAGAMAAAIADDRKPAPPAGRATAATQPKRFELPESFSQVPPPAPARDTTAPGLRARDVGRDPARPGRWLRVCVDGDRYAVELLRVQEVVRVVPVVWMRGTEPAVLGVMNLRGRIVPVFDLGLWLGTTAVRPDERARIVVVERNDELIGLLVTAVNDVTTLAAEHIEAPVGAGAAPGAIIGIARANDAPTVLLDADCLFD